MILLYALLGNGSIHLGVANPTGLGTKAIARLVPRFSQPESFGVRNRQNMRRFAEAYPSLQFVQQLVAQIVREHNTHGTGQNPGLRTATVSSPAGACP